MTCSLSRVEWQEVWKLSGHVLDLIAQPHLPPTPDPLPERPVRIPLAPWVAAHSVAGDWLQLWHLSHGKVPEAPSSSNWLSTSLSQCPPWVLKEGMELASEPGHILLPPRLLHLRAPGITRLMPERLASLRKNCHEFLLKTWSDSRSAQLQLWDTAVLDWPGA